MTHRLIIVRHGNTFETGEPLRRIGARTDMPLTKSGHTQADSLAHRFARERFRFDRILTGALARTRATADAVAACQTPLIIPEIAQFLLEIDHGPDENALEADVVERIGQDALDAWDRSGICPPDWIDNRAARIDAWQSLAADARPGGTTVCVTSNGAARFALAAFGVSPPSRKLRTGAWGTIVLDGKTAQLVDWDVRPSPADG